MNKKYKIIISGGGTGGHIFPAVAIADEFKRRFSNIEILFVGAEGKMEMEKVPKAGYNIVGLPIVGLKRGFYLSNLFLPFKLLNSLMRARKITRKFQPNLVIGVGGYASGPILKMAQMLKIPTLIQEQNSFAGKTNKLLASKAFKICVAYENMNKFFPAEKIIETGNPVRQNLKSDQETKKIAIDHFGLVDNKKTILIIGGSLGAKTLNDSMLHQLHEISQHKDIQIVWQCGSRYYHEIKTKLENFNTENVKLLEFINDMNLAYNAADLVISRAGALSVSELCLLGKASILVPSPNVAEDHQTTNARALVSKDAAMLMEDKKAKEYLIQIAIETVRDDNRIKELENNVKKMGRPNATVDIVNICLSILENEK